MVIVDVLLRVTGGICLFLYGMKVLSDGIQQAAGNRMQRALNFMTRNRFVGVLTGLTITAIIQSSSAVSVMLVSFVNAGLLNLTQAIGVIMGANIGTTTTAWIVSLIGFEFDVSAFALPSVGIGFIMQAIKWKHRALGEVFMGFGFLFLGLRFLTDSLPTLNSSQMEFVRAFSGGDHVSTLIGLGIGVGITLLMHSSSASITLIITLAMGAMISFEFAAAMILGANIGTTVDAIMAAVGAKAAAKQTALVHLLFNVVGSVVALIFFKPLIALVDTITPGSPGGSGVAAHLAMFHTIFNLLGTLIFLPFVKQFARLVTFIIRDREEPSEAEPRIYRLEQLPGMTRNTPELNIIRAEKEIRDMAGLASRMFSAVGSAFISLPLAENREAETEALLKKMREQEEYVDQMRVELTSFLIECTRPQLNYQSEKKIYQLLRVISDLEDITDNCYSAALLLERSVKKDLFFKHKEMQALSPYVRQVEEFLFFVREHLGRTITAEQASYAENLENAVNKSRNKLRKLGRKRIEAGKDVRTELLFIDLVRRIEKVGDYCYNIAGTLRRQQG